MFMVVVVKKVKKSEKFWYNGKKSPPHIFVRDGILSVADYNSTRVGVVVAVVVVVVVV